MFNEVKKKKIKKSAESEKFIYEKKMKINLSSFYSDNMWSKSNPCGTCKKKPS